MSFLKKIWEKIKKLGFFKILLILLLIGAAVVGYRIYKAAQAIKEMVQTSVYTQTSPERRDLEKILTGSGTLQPANSYSVMTLVEGEILECSFEEGDVVEKDSVLYRIDSSDLSGNLERARISLDQTKRNVSDVQNVIYIKAQTAGQLVSLNVSAGDYVMMNQQIGTVMDSSVMTVKLPFSSADAKGFFAGQDAQVIIDGSFESLSGKITQISGADIAGTGGMMTRNVTIEVKNPGALSSYIQASAVVAGASSTQAAYMSPKSTSALTAKTSGEVKTVNVKEGSYVKKDQTVVTLGGSDIEENIKRAKESLRSAELSMEATRDQLDNYTVLSPISGTIVDKSGKTGDKASAGNILCTIYDLSYLEMVLNIDELDIMKMQVGQPVKITADAIEGREFSGVVTKVSVAGTTMSGTTSYPVTIRIDEADGLLPGMNVDASIVAGSVKNALTVPNSAIVRGNVVLVSSDSPSAVNALDDMNAPEGYVYVSVKTGISDDDRVEILEGLQEGDTVSYIEQSAAGNSWMNMFGGMGSNGGNSGRP